MANTTPTRERTNADRFLHWLTGSDGYATAAEYQADVVRLFGSPEGERVLAYWVARTRSGVLPGDLGRLGATEQILVQHAVMEFVNSIVMTMERVND